MNAFASYRIIIPLTIGSVARIGVRALVYEATGFEKLKHPEALRMLIESYLTEEERKWMKEFPDEFFAELDRIYGNERHFSGIGPLITANLLGPTYTIPSNMV